MLTPVQSLLDLSYTATTLPVRESVEQFLTSVDGVTFDQFAYLNENLEVEQLAICFLTDDVVSVVIQAGLDKEAIKSLSHHYTEAKSVRVYYSDIEDFPRGDDWSVEGLSFLMDNPTFDETLPAFEVKREEVFVTLKTAEQEILGTFLEDLNSFSLVVEEEYNTEQLQRVKTVMAFCNAQECRLLVQALDNSWIKPMLDMGFAANRWILKADFVYL